MNEAPGKITQGTTEAFVERLYVEARAGRFGTRPFGKMILVDEPEAIHEILRAPDTYFKDYGVVANLGLSRFNTNGADWRMRQALTQRHYSTAARPEHRETVTDAYRSRIAALNQPTGHQLRDALLAAAASIFHGALGCDVPDAHAVGLLDNLREITATLQRHALFGGSPDDKMRVANLIRAIFREIDRYESSAPDFAAILQRLRDGATEIPEFSAREEYAFNYSAGVETSAASMAWMVELLGVFPELQEHCAEEVAAGGECPLMERFIDESMRRFPPVPFHVRMTTEPVRIAGVDLPKGHRIVLSIIGAHHHPDYWTRPLDFDPERPEWSNGENIAYIPFSAGQRRCGGMRIARIEASESVAAILSTYRVSRNAGVATRFKVALAMRADNWDAITLHRR